MASHRLRVFISSVQKEFAHARQSLKAFLLGDAFLRRFVSEVFLFEDFPAKDRRADEVYLEEVGRCDIYLGLFGYDYGYEDAKGISPTEHEFDHATEKRKTRLIYVWGATDDGRHPKMRKLIGRAGSQVIRRRVDSINAMNAEVYASLVDVLDEANAFKIAPFDKSACEGATLKNLSRKRIDWFLETARRERGFPLTAETTTKALLSHLNLLEGTRPTSGAMVLFGVNPQHFHRPAETKCVHCHGTEYRRPFGSQQIFGGDLFDQADQARDFVLSKINRKVGTRAEGSAAPVNYELPPDAVAEAIINALAHRDYHSSASVEVRLFTDRLEIWNPGSLPGTLTTADLRQDHPSVPNNPLIADPLYLARYIEKAGSGTQAIIRLCREAGLPEPDFEQRSGSFVTTLWRHWLTDEELGRFNLNDRQRQGIDFLRTRGRVTNAEYQELTGTTPKTAARDLTDLREKGLLVQIGASGRGVHYVLQKRKQDINGTNET